MKTKNRTPRRLGGSLLLALLALTALAVYTAITMRDPLKLMLEWELLAVFVRPETHDWYRIVISQTGFEVATDAFIIAGAGWLLLLAKRRSRHFPSHVQAWLLIIVVMRTGAYLIGDYMTHAIRVDIAIPLDGFIQSLVFAALGIPYVRLSQRVHETFIER